MRRSTTSFLAVAAALLLGWNVLLRAESAGQEAEGTAEGSQAQVADDTSDRTQPAADIPRMKRKATGRPLLPGSTLPPGNLKLVRDHWTPWDPPDPESFPPDATLHIIVPGDTLWDLADLAYGNPYLWPQIWNENRYILDSHWIYPGDPLLIPARPTVVTEVVPQGPEVAPAPEEPAPVEEPLAAEAPEEETPFKEAPPPRTRPVSTEPAYAPRTIPKVKPLVDESDIRCSGFIARKEEEPDYFIANQEEDAKIGLLEGDIVYLNRGTENGHLEPGVEYSIVVSDGEVRHPLNHDRLGIYYRRKGSVKVLQAFEKTAIAEITMACDEIRTGFDLAPLRVTTLPANDPPPFNRLDVTETGKPVGYIVHVLDNVRVAATGTIVEIDLGYADGLEPGDFLTAFIHIEPYEGFRQVDYKYEWNRHVFEPPPQRRHDKNHYPPRILGQLVVIGTEKHTATAKIINSVREIELGTLVEVY